MARLSIEDLVKVAKDLDETSEIPGIPGGINQPAHERKEWADFSVKQDLTRVRLASKTADVSTNPTNKAKAAQLAVKLDYASRCEIPPQTVASSGYMEVHRSAIRQMVPEFLRSGATDVYAFSILTGKGEMPIDQLNAQDAVELND